MCAAAARAIKGTWRQQPAQPAGMALSNPLSSVVGRGYLQSQDLTIRYRPNPSDTCCLVVKAWLCRSLKPVSKYFEFLATDHDDNAFSWLSSFASIHYGLYCEIRVPVVGVFWMLFCQVFGSWTKSCPSSGQVKNLRLGIVGKNAGTFGWHKLMRFFHATASWGLNDSCQFSPIDRYILFIWYVFIYSYNSYAVDVLGNASFLPFCGGASRFSGLQVFNLRMGLQSQARNVDRVRARQFADRPDPNVAGSEVSSQRLVVGLCGAQRGRQTHLHYWRICGNSAKNQKSLHNQNVLNQNVQ